MRTMLPSTPLLPSVALALGAVISLVVAGPVAAECPGPLQSWPSLAIAVPDAKVVVVGEVVESLGDNPPGLAVAFRLRIDEVLRGESLPLISFRGLQSGEPGECTLDAILRVRVGDILAIASDGQLPTLESGWTYPPTAPPPHVAVAFIRGEPALNYMPRMRTITLERVHQVVLPETATAPPSAPAVPAPDPFVPIATLAVMLVVVHAFQRRLQVAPE